MRLGRTFTVSHMGGLSGALMEGWHSGGMTTSMTGY